MPEKCLIFYSWQSDIRESRSFISNCMSHLPAKCSDIVPVEVSRDTQGLAGSPNIGDAIYEKIDKADIFVADVTIINPEASGRKTPNPNVMIELGYAIKALGWDHIVILYNSDCGDVEKLPFDINHQRMTGYSLKECGKAESQKKIIRSIAGTIEILKTKGVLHGGRPQMVRIRNEISSLLWNALDRVKDDYEDRHWNEAEGHIEYIPITEAALTKADNLCELLTEEQSNELLILLTKLRLAVLGTDDAHGWEFAEEVAKKCFDEVYIAYGGRMTQLSLEQILTSEMVDLFNAISCERKIKFLPERVCDEKVVFLSDDQIQKAWDNEGKILCDGVMTERGFTGFRCTREYEGEYVNNIRHGIGRERSGIMWRSRFGCGEFRKDGRWDNGIFVEGKVFSAVLTEKGGQYIYQCCGENDILTADCFFMDDFFSDCTEENEKVYVADMILHNGEYDIIEGTIKQLNENDVDNPQEDDDEVEEDRLPIEKF